MNWENQQQYKSAMEQCPNFKPLYVYFNPPKILIDTFELKRSATNLFFVHLPSMQLQKLDRGARHVFN